MQYSLEEGNIDGEVFIEFLKHLIKKRQRPPILLVDHAIFHDSKQCAISSVRTGPN